MTVKGISESRPQLAARIKHTLLLAFVIFSLGACRNTDSSTMAATPLSLANAPASGGVAAQSSYADIVSRVAPAVVTIHSELRARAPQQFPFMDDPFFNQFFGERGGRAPQQQPQRASAIGSGVIVSPDGYIITNHHVIDGATQIKVDLSDSRTVDAKVVGSDAASDLAVLKVNASSLPVLNLGNSDNVRVGDVALAIGNPLGVGQTVTMGIISAKGRQTGLSNGSFEDFLQTDAPINQGNSGGALVNTNGELIGINSQILSRSGGSIGIGFAVPSNMARDVMEQLIKNGKVRRGQLGVGAQKVTSDIAASLGLKDTRGVLVSQVQPGSAAERAGIKQGDLITSLGGSPVSDPNSFRNAVARTQPGSPVQLTVMRGGKEQQISATLGEFTPEKSADGDQGDTGGSGNKAETTGKLGIGVQPLTPEIAQQLRLRNVTQGLVIGEVDPNSPAADAGLQQGDVIVQVNQQPVRSVAELKAAIDRAGSRPALLLINRRGTTVFVPVTPRQ
ncbi:MAG: DegQ family serine endoprotease [Pyrinomonadaceae bacterium]